MNTAMNTMTLVVAGIDDSVPGIRSLRLTDPGGVSLPSFVPGSHLVLECGDVSNAYSLTGPDLLPAVYEVSVLKVAEADGGRGGSAWIHGLAVGDEVTALPPRSAFAPVQRATKHLLVAGGIGITPMVSHLRAAAAWGRDAELFYCHRDGLGAHLDTVRELSGRPARLFTDRTSFLHELREALVTQPMGTHLFVCGPSGFMDAVSEAAAELGWPSSRVHGERFGVDVLDPGEPFDVTLTKSGTTITVDAGTSLLEALESSGVAVPNMCRQGVCGECRIPVSAGTPLHRDLFLADDEKSAGDSLMCCVSRAATEKLEVPL